MHYGIRRPQMKRGTVSGICFAIAVVLVFLPKALGQSISGLHVGDSRTAVEGLKLKSIAKENQGSTETTKFRLANGIDLSVTLDIRKNRIVYIETDWNQTPEGAASDFPGLKFGSSTLEDIRKTNGSNGFSYRTTAMGESNGNLITFNAYRIENKPGIVAVFVTALNIAELRKKIGNREPTQADLSGNLKLDALILADESYLDEIWGKEKTYDPANTPIKWND
jgi:hypothetical protein